MGAILQWEEATTHRVGNDVTPVRPAPLFSSLFIRCAIERQVRRRQRTGGRGAGVVYDGLDNKSNIFQSRQRTLLKRTVLFSSRFRVINRCPRRRFRTAGTEATRVLLMENHSQQLDVADEDQLMPGRGYDRPIIFLLADRTEGTCDRCTWRSAEVPSQVHQSTIADD